MHEHLANEILEVDRQPEATVHVGRQHIARLVPALDCVERLLTVVDRTFVCEGPLGYQELSRRMSHCSRDQDALTFSASFTPRIIAHLQSAGYHVRVREELLRPLTMDWNDANASARERERVHVVAHHGLSRIEVADDRDARDLCGLVAEAFPDAKILVVAPNASTAKKLTKLLQSLLREPVRLFCTGARLGQARCNVAIAGSMPEGRYDLIVLPFLDECLGKVPIERLQKIHFLAKRVVGCTVAGKHYGPSQQLQLEEIAGPVRCVLCKPRVPVFFAMLPTPRCRTNPATTPHGRQRTMFDGNDVRNRFVAGVARAMQQEPQSTCESLFGKLTTFSKRQQSKPPRVVVLAESAEQARHLARYLPRWRLEVGHPRALHGLLTNPTSEHAIITSYYAARHGISADILIRATGTRSPLNVRRFPARVMDGEEWQLALVIDFDDRFNAFSAAQARARRRGYSRSGAKELEPRSFNPFKWILPVSERDSSPCRRGS